MLKFTEDQQNYVLNARRAFHRQEEALAARIGNASPIPKDVWGEWDKESVQIQRSVLAVFNDLAATLAKPMPIGKLVHHFRTVSDNGQATISLDGKYKGLVDRPEYADHGTPVPIIADVFELGWRDVEAARSEGIALETDARDNSTRKVAEKLEDITINGDSSIVVDTTQLHGLRTHPKRSTRTTGQPLNGATGAQWVADVTATLELLHAKNFRVPATLYLNWDDWFYASNTDYSTLYPNKTIAQRIAEIGSVAGIVPASKVPAGDIIAVVKERRALQILNALPVVTRPRFRANPEDDYEFMVMAAAALEIKFDADDQCGVAQSAL